MNYEFKLDGLWVLIFIVISILFLIYLIVVILFLIEFLQRRLNCICICMGVRLSQRYSFLSIPLFCICRRRRNNVTQILPVNLTKIYTPEEYYFKTGNKIIIDPDNSINIGFSIT